MALKFLNNGYFAGKVGIGTDSPSSNLDIEDASGVTIDINSSSGDGMFRFQDDGTTKWAIGRDNTQQNFVFSNSAGLASDNVLTLAHSTGNVGIGTASPQSGGGSARWLSLNGTAAYSGGVVYTIDSTTKAYSYFESDYLKQQAQTGFGQKFIVNGTNTAMTILSGGNVGIGTTSPTHLLTLETASSPGIKIKDTTQGATLLAFSQDSNSHLGTYSAHPLVLDTNSTERLRITSAGNVGIGTTSPRSIIEAKGNISIFDPSNTLSNGDTLNGLHFYTDEYSYNPPGGRVNTPISKILPVVDSSGTDSFGLSFYTAASDVESSEKLRISSSGNVGIGTTSPGSKLTVFGDIMLRNPNGANPTDAGSFIFNESGTTWGTDIYGFRFNLNGSSNVLTLQSANTTTVNDIISFTRDSARVGIGTTSPSQKLHVSGNARVTGAYYDSNNLPGTSGQVLSSTATGTDWVSLSEISGVDGTGTTNYVAKWSDTDTITDSVIYDNGTNVGIGTTSPGSKLEVNSGGSDSVARFTSTDARARILISDNNDISYFGTYIGTTFLGPDDTPSGNTINVLSNGNVGIGTTSPGTYAKLEVSTSGQYEGIVLSNGTNSVGWISGNSASNDNGQLSLSSGGVQKVQINAASNSYFNGGNVGIGTTSPNNKLDVNGGARVNGILTLNRGSVAGLKFSRGSDFYLGIDNSGNLNFLNDSASSLGVWKNDGNVGIGTTSPASKLDVQGGMSQFSTTLTNNEDWENSPISINERGQVGSTQSADKYAPNLNFHWAGRSSKSLWLNSTGVLHFGEYSSTGIPDATGTFSVNTIALTGTGRITGVDTVSAGTDAASKTYVDNAITTATSAYLPLAGGTMSGPTLHGDGIHSYWGASNDLQIDHDGNHSVINNLTGHIYISNESDDGDIVFRSDNGFGGVTEYFRLDGGSGYSVASKDIRFDDNVKAKFGISNDLQIYHDGSNSYIQDTGTGTLNLQGSTQVLIGGTNGEVGVQYVENAGVGLRHNNVTKLTTESTGINVVGEIKIDSALLSNQENTDIDTGAEVVAQVSTSTYTAAFFDFVIKKVGNIRSGTVYACHDGTNVEFTETSTNDLGDTSDVTLSVDKSGTNLRLIATVTSDDWIIKSLIRAI